MTDEPEYTGGSVSYYTCSVTHPISETADPYDAECIDIIDALQMTPNEANAFKALWRRAAARLGKSKRGYTNGLYDAEKVEFYGKRLVELERRARPATEPDPIVKKHVDKILKGEVSFPEGIVGCAIEKAFGATDPNPQNMPKADFTHGNDWRDMPRCVAPKDMTQCVEVIYKNGASFLGTAFSADWNRAERWRFAQPTGPFGPRDADGWYNWNGDDTMRPAGQVFYEMRDGGKGRDNAEDLSWRQGKNPDDIVKWRPA